jgi:hypothetical protein
MRLLRLSSLALILYTPAGDSQGQRYALPKGCGTCEAAGSLARGSFSAEAKLLKAFTLPNQLDARDAKLEPWVFRLIVNRDGISCSIELMNGPSGSFSRAFLSAARTWQFHPFILKGHTICFMSTVYCYLRTKQNGTPYLIVPGVTEAY